MCVGMNARTHAHAHEHTRTHVLAFYPCNDVYSIFLFIYSFIHVFHREQYRGLGFFLLFFLQRFTGEENSEKEGKIKADEGKMENVGAQEKLSPQIRGEIELIVSLSTHTPTLSPLTSPFPSLPTHLSLSPSLPSHSLISHLLSPLTSPHILSHPHFLIISL